MNTAQIKKELRITSETFDVEIECLILSAQADLARVGIGSTNQDTAVQILIDRAIIFYCKAFFGYDNPDHDKNLRAYDTIKTSLALDSRITD